MSRVFLLVAVAALFATVTACDQFELDEAQPSTSISLDQTFTSVSGFDGVLVSMYDRLQGTALYGQQYMLYPDALADNANLVQGATSNRYPTVVANQPFTHLTGYGALYSTVNEANNILADIDGFVPDAENPDAITNRISGEARFLRGLAYFDLVRIYSYMPGSIDGRNREAGDFDLGVPLRLEPVRSSAQAQPIPRVSNDSIYAQAVADFSQAANLLENNPAASTGPARATAAAAAGMLSRVHLYIGNWSEAESAATRALSLTSAQEPGTAEFESAWSAETYPGSIFELRMTSGQDATGGGSALQDITFFKDPDNDGQANNFAYELIPSDDVRSIYDAADVRDSLFAEDPNGNVYLEKYSGTIANNTDRIPLLRVAELYLNRAEARAQQDDFSGARADLNTIRNLRGLPDIGSGVSGGALVDEILEERRREFLFEGKRFFTLKRYARDIPKPQLGSSIDYDGPLNERRLVLSFLPTNEVQSNPELEQNPGY
jgi:hypothetical protein